MKKLVLALASVFFLAACTGNRGPQGPPGLDGAANVEAFEYEVTPSAWAAAGNIGDPNFGFVALGEFPEITADIINNGTVIGYKIEGEADAPMPVLYYENGFQINFDYLAYIGEVEFWKRASDNMTEAPTEVLYYKMVIIESAYKSDIKEDFSQYSLSDLEERFNITEYKKVTVE